MFIRLFAFIFALHAGPVHSDNAFVSVFGDVTTITSGNKAAFGGFVPAFRAAAQYVLLTGKQIRIDGLCGSACATFADEARPNVCITQNAVFGFHKEKCSLYAWTREPPADELTVYTDPRFSTDIAMWVNKHGGYPVERVLLMNYDEAAAFWPQCK